MNLNEWLEKSFPAESVEDCYPLSPVQEGIHLHVLRQPRAAMFFQQMILPLSNIDPELIIQAWKMVVKRHDILRTSFHWQGLDAPVQVVHKDVDLSVESLDWSDVEKVERQGKMRALLREDRKRGFDLSQAPLLRLTLIDWGGGEYSLVKSHHHILLDGWSAPLLFGDVQKAYYALSRGESPQFSSVPPFRSYIDWLDRQDLSNARLFWSSYLSGFCEQTVLPSTAKIASPASYFVGEHVRLSAGRFKQLCNQAKNLRVTPGILVEAAWALLLSRWSDEEDIIFGVTFSGRSADLGGIDRIIGLFINVLPIRIHIRAEQRLDDWLKEINEQHYAIQGYDYSPPGLVQSSSDMPDHVPLYDTIFTYNSQSMVGGRNGERKTDQERTRSSESPTNYSLSLKADETGDALEIELTGVGTLYTSTALARLLDQVLRLLDAFIVNPAAEIGSISLMTSQDWQQTIYDWNQTSVDYPKNQLLHQVLEEATQATPDADALFFAESRVTFGDLNKRANQLAGYLHNHCGVKPGILVGISVGRSIDMVIALLAVLKAGGAYVPLDPDYPQERLELLIKDSGLSLILTEKGSDTALPSFADIRLIYMDSDRDVWRSFGMGNLQVEMNPENIALVIYTSGSTGRPKGVALPHRVFVNRLYTDADPLEADEVLSAKTSLNFIDSIWELFFPWLYGRPTLLLTKETIQDPELLVHALADACVSRMVLVPSLMRSILEPMTDISRQLPCLKHLICSGEPLPGDLVQLFHERLPGRVLTNLYGTSETWDVTRSDTRGHPENEALHIGRPMGNCQVYILDRRLQPVPVGMPGELCVAGQGLAHGYYGRPELTAECFVANPFCEEPGSMLYRTGDRARWRADGQVEFLGRVDFQLKIRGFRVEPGEVEAVLRAHPKIRDIVVTAGHQQQLLAYVVYEDGEAPDVSELRDFSRLHLPAHLVPASFMALDALPLTPSGKVDRRALPTPDNELQDRVHSYVAPRTDIEKVIAAEWEHILQVNHIGIYDNFFDLGGHSLLATRIISRLRSALEMNIPIPALFQEPTIAGLAEWIENRGDDQDFEEDISLEAADEVPEGVRIVPQSFAQQRMWFLSEVASGSALYNLSGAIPFKEYVEPEVLRRCLTELARRHESLRTTYASRDGEPVQIIAEAAPVDMDVVDLRGFPLEQRRMQLNRLRREENNKPFDLANGPVIRFKLVVMGDERQILLYAMHHIITDGWSMAVFLRELRIIYTAYKSGRPSPLPEPKLQYADFATWQRNWLKGNVLQRQIDYWRKRLDGAAYLELPVDRQRRPTPRYISEQIPLQVPDSILPELRDLAQHENATLFMLMLAAFQFVLGRNAGQDDVVVGTPVANRTRAELEGIIGFFVNTLVLRSDLSGKPSFRELLKRVRESCLGAYSHQDIPFERVVEELAPQRELNIQPLFQVLFVLQNTPSTGEDSAQSQETIVSDADVAGLTFYDITLSLTEAGDHLSGTLHYNTDLFDLETAERFKRHYLMLLEHIVEAPDKPLSHEFLLHEGEKEMLLKRAQVSTMNLPVRCVHHIFEEAVDRGPEHLAVVFGNQQLSYAELDARANSLAHELIHRGVQVETTVGLCVERGIDAIVGLLAILKAGGTYVPLNPELPQERLGWMIKDAAPAVILTRDAQRSGIPEDCGVVLSFEELEKVVQPRNTTRLGNIADPQHLAYIIYTSGSTGKPKGVMIEHRSLCHTIMGQIPLFGITPESKVLSTIALSFDASLGEIFRTLLAGATLYLAPREQLLPGPELIRLLRENHITTTTLVPSVLAALPADEELTELTTLTVGGEALSSELAQLWGKGRRLLNGYGPTEATIGATLATDWPPGETPPLGFPLPGVYAYVLDEDMKLLPDAISGELYLGGPGLARGYLNQPDLTAKTFLPDPFSDEPGARLYRTGDRVRWRNDGQLSFLGRMDEQVKIRGHRIEPGEISSVLKQRPDIGEAVIVARSDHHGGQRLVAYLVRNAKAAAIEPAGDAVMGGDQGLLSDLRQYLRGKLPDYMVPSAFVLLESLPLTPHGKLDRKALPDPEDENMMGSDVPYVAPENEVESRLAEIWAELLRLDQVGVNDNFFELGGDSILSIRVIARAAEAGIILTPVQVYQNQTVKEQALVAQVEQAMSDE